MELNSPIKGPAWACTGCAAAWCLGLTLEDINTYIGHDGSELVGSFRRGYSMDEMQDVANERGHSFVHVNVNPVVSYGSMERVLYPEPQQRLLKYFKGYGIFIVQKDHMRHALGHHYEGLGWPTWMNPANGEITMSRGCPYPIISYYALRRHA